MFEHIKEFIKENPGTAAIAGIMAAALFLGSDNISNTIQEMSGKRSPSSSNRNIDREDKSDNYGKYNDSAFENAFNDKNQSGSLKPKKETGTAVVAQATAGGVGFGFGGAGISGGAKSDGDSGSSSTSGGSDGGGDNYASDELPDYTDQGTEGGGNEELPPEDLITSTDDIDDGSTTSGSTDGSTDLGSTSTGATTGGFAGGGGGGAPIVPTVSAYPGEGIYVNNPLITLTATNSNEIYYCIQKGGGCCDPTSAGTGTLYDDNDGALVSYLAPGTQDNGNFCLAFYALTPGNIESAVMEILYTVNDNAIDISYAVSPLQKQLKSTQDHLNIPYISDSFGFPDYSFFTLNAGVTEPASATTGFPSDCEDLTYTYGQFNDPYLQHLREPAGFLIEDTDGLSLSDTIEVPLLHENTLNNSLVFGDNWIVGMMRYDDPINVSKFGCISTKVVVADTNSHGPVMSYNASNGTLKSTPNINGVVEFQGQINTFGHFNYGSVSGDGKKQEGDYILENGYINITH